LLGASVDDQRRILLVNHTLHHGRKRTWTTRIEEEVRTLGKKEAEIYLDEMYKRTGTNVC
jgi:hypothetical protein